MPPVKPPPSQRKRHPAIRATQLVVGGLLIVGAGLVSPLPVPVGIFLFSGGMVLILRNSRWAKRRWARLKRRWPRGGHLVDRAMRRPSALRRHARTTATKTGSGKGGGKSVRVN